MDVPPYVHEARSRMNDGDYAGALTILEAEGWESDGDPSREGARRLGGCLMLVVGRYAEGLALLERCRTEGVRPRFPAVRYAKGGHVMSESAAIAVGLLECLALGASVAELAGGGSAFGDAATLRSLRLLGRALAREGHAGASKAVMATARRWAAARR
jgi:hypothetical protein